MDDTIISSVERRRSVFHSQNVKFEQDIIKYDKTSDEENLLIEALLKNDFLKNILSETTRRLIVDIMTPQTVSKDEIVIQQGEMGEYMYVSQSGVYQVLKNDVEHHRFKDHTVFGEVAIIYDHDRQATVKALEDGKLWKIHRDEYCRVMVTSAMEQETEILSFLKNVQALKEAPEEKLKQAVGLFTKLTFTAGTNIVVEGDEGNDFYIIRAGTVRVSTKSEGVVANLARGQYFGEHALLKDDKIRRATVTAESPVVECLVLYCTHFKNLFGGLTEFLQSNTTETDAANRSVSMPATNEYSSVSLQQLKLRASIGIGGFARVELAHLQNDTSKLFALKYMKRADIVKFDAVKCVLYEKSIQLKCNSPFIVQLYKTYNDRRYLYLLQEYCPGGDVLHLLQRLKYCKEVEAKFVAACILEALGYLHDRNYIFRDIKPENMVFDAQGYVKLTDFGCAKRLDPGQRTYTMVAAPEYIAPEFIYRRGYDRAVDYWAFGVFVFELFVGKTPFRTTDRSHMQTYNMIVRGIDHVTFPSKIPSSAADIIRKLCNAVPHDRLGYCRGVEEVREHKWYQGFKWDKLRRRQIKSPFPIKLSNDMDTRYFDNFKPDKDLPPYDDTEILNNF